MPKGKEIVLVIIFDFPRAVGNIVTIVTHSHHKSNSNTCGASQLAGRPDRDGNQDDHVEQRRKKSLTAMGKQSYTDIMFT
jgi:hypothetical protein